MIIIDNMLFAAAVVAITAQPKKVIVIVAEVS